MDDGDAPVGTAFNGSHEGGCLGSAVQRHEPISDDWADAARQGIGPANASFLALGSNRFAQRLDCAHVPRRIGRKLVTLPNGETVPVRPWDVAPTTIQLALARGHRWLAMLESGDAKSLKGVAAHEGVDNSYVSRMVNLTTLAPDIVAAILDDALPNHVTLFDLAVDPPALWDEQRERLTDPTTNQ